MFLRSLDIRGFKSFADRTALEFTPGISVIVGPNGSGKSNLVDAITWVLGEQGPRALRGASMADVIFAGSPGRQGLGMAQVTLVVDNSAGIIPVPLTEIEISRAVYRSGESQYFVGGSPARLLDIQELLAETGIGRALHTVVGQNQLEDVLTARPEERRQYIEEAAGIAKHRRRRERAERKLASIEQDVLRLQDVLAELRRQLKPLRQQAEMAKRHESLSEEATTVAVRLAAARLRALYRDRDARRSGWEEGMTLRRETEERLAALDAALAALGGRREAAEETLRRTAAEAEAATATRSESEGLLRAAVRAEGEARARLAEAGNRSGRITLLEADLERTDRALEEVRVSLASRSTELEAADASYAEARGAREAAEAASRAAHEEAARRRAEADALQRSLEGYERERERLEVQLADVDRRLGELDTERERLGGEIERLDATETPLSKEQARVERERSALLQEVRELDDREARLSARLAGARERLEAAAETPGRRFLRERPGRGAGTLNDLLRVEAGYELAVAAALGPFADLVLPDGDDAALEDLEAVPGPAFALEPVTDALIEDPGDRPLLDVVTPDPRALAVARALLGAVFVVEDLSTAADRRRRFPRATFVTRDGHALGPIVARRVEAAGEILRELREDAEGLERDLAQARDALGRRREGLAAAEREAARVGGRLDEADALITAAADRMGRVAADLASLGREREVLAERLAALEEAARSWGDALAAVPPPAPDAGALPPAPEPPMALRVEVESLRREGVRLETSAARVRDELATLRAEDPTSLASAAERAQSERAAAEAGLAAAAERVEAAGRARDEAAAEDRRLREEEADTNRRWREAAAELARLRDDYEEADQTRRDLERRVQEAERVLAEGHGRAPAEALAELTEEDTIETLSRRADLVARRLALLGRVNLLATDEFGALQERHDFLQRELEDVREARRELHQVIADVDARIVESFDRAYRDVAESFQELFTQLFPGGEGRVMLTQPEDLLATGIDLEARPGRKKVKRLSLLSGGERALTALCFLFAIFRARPSPFYLLDEVEAALDDVNLHRFLDLIRGFARDSQVILVTHQKRTMEVADVLYGVSMGKDGATAVIAQRMEGEGRTEGASPGSAPEPERAEAPDPAR
jgi:chromosome segregation protein